MSSGFNVLLNQHHDITGKLNDFHFVLELEQHLEQSAVTSGKLAALRLSGGHHQACQALQGCKGLGPRVARCWTPGLIRLGSV